MKFKSNDKYFTIAVYTVATVCISVIGVALLLQFKVIGGYLVTMLGKVIRLFKPLIFGFIIAYLLEPIVQLYDQKSYGLHWPHHKVGGEKVVGTSRGVATTLTFLTLIAFTGLFVLIISINMRRVMGTLSGNNFDQNIKGYVEYFQSVVANVEAISKNIPLIGEKYNFIEKLYNMVEVFVESMGDKLISSVVAIGGQLISIALGCVLAFYMLKDKRRLLNVWQRFCHLIIPEGRRSEIMDIGRDIDLVFSGYIRGQVIDAMIMATLISSALTLIGIDFAVIIGIISGIFNLIPYFGPVVGFVLAGFIGFIGPEPEKGIYAVLAVMALQQLDGWVIVPRVIGRSVRLHPIAVLLAIVIGGQLFGLVGFLLAVPTVGLVRLLIIRYMGDVFSGEAT